MSVACVALLAAALLTIIIAINSYYWSANFNAAHAIGINSHGLFIAVLFHSARGGICCTFRCLAGSKGAIEPAINEYYQWHPAIERSLDSIAFAEKIYSLSYPISYRFMPTSPAPFGFQSHMPAGPYMGRSYWLAELAIPYWFPAMTFIVATAALQWRRRTEQRRQLAGRCLHCGYDRRHSPDRCPECGSL